MTAARQARYDHQGQSDESKLFEIIKERSFLLGELTLSSGAKSNKYFNMKATMMDPEGAYLSARAFLAKLHGMDADYIGGLEMGAVPMIGSLAAIGYLEGRPIRTFFVRKEPKGHGTQKRIEGLGPAESLSGRKVVVADDVATSGQSFLKAINEVKAAGGLVDTAICLVDREEGGAELLAHHGVTLVSVFRAIDFTG